MAIHLDQATSVSIGGVDLTGFARDIGFELDPWQAQMLHRVESLPSGRVPLYGFRWTSRGYASPGFREAIVAAVEATRAVRRRRIRRMHAAYGRRRGRGRR